jgi:cytosine/adenosine deaminase-related metal-dependent hydrolase
MRAETRVVRAGCLADASGVRRRGGAVAVRDASIVAAASATGGPEIDAGGLVVLPALVNAHCHLDLSHLGPRPAGHADFIEWLDGIRTARAPGDEAIAASVDQGIALSLAGGSAAVGDIAGARSTVPLRRLRAAGLRGVSFVEVIELRRAPAEAAAALRDLAGGLARERGPGHVRHGLTPHAPWTCPVEVYRAAVKTGLPLATHLAESPEEVEFLRTGGGAMGRFFERLGLPAGSRAAGGAHPIDRLSGVLHARPWVAAHVIQAEPGHIDVLAASGTSVVYCPRAAEYFRHDRDRPHRYRDMLARGVNVALGTDGLPCLDTPDRISVLDEMRRLHRRDGADPVLLLRMATTAGAAALGLDPALFTLRPGPIAGLIGVPFDPASPVDPLEQALRRDDPPAWLAGPF